MSWLCFSLVVAKHRGYIKYCYSYPLLRIFSLQAGGIRKFIPPAASLVPRRGRWRRGKHDDDDDDDVTVICAGSRCDTCIRADAHAFITTALHIMVPSSRSTYVGATCHSDKNDMRR